MSYLRYVCLFVYSGVQHILCAVFLFCLSSSCVTSFSGLFLTTSVFLNIFNLRRYVGFH
jgi:hypothetical protein